LALVSRWTRGRSGLCSECRARTGAFVSTGGPRPQGEIPGDTLNECSPETASPVCGEHHQGHENDRVRSYRGGGKASCARYICRRCVDGEAGHPAVGVYRLSARAPFEERV